MSLLAPCIRASGPADAKIAFVGEAPGETEEQMGLPLVGRSGQEFTEMLREAGLERRHCYLTNVLFTRPPGNKLEAFLVKKDALPSGYSLPAVKQGAYLHPDLLPELSRLRDELTTLRPNLIVALGNTALWALTGSSRISSARGTVTTSSLIDGLKVLPTYHPAGVLRNWSWRPIVLQDLFKAAREMEFPEVRRPARRITIDPTLEEVESFIAEALAAPVLASDIETEKGQITTIGFATSPQRAFVIPFWDKRQPGWSYWPTLGEELRAWKAVESILTRHPQVVFQNGLYDVQYIWRMGIPVPGFSDDTMLLHHSMYPELPKGLGFLGSVYTNDISWKQMRQRHGSQETKREE